MNDKGRAAVVLDTGAASRGSGNANTNKEKDVRKWFVEQDLIEGVIYLPENLFYNTTAPGIIIVLNKAKPKERRGKLFLLNASREFVKGDPKNYIPDDAIMRIAETFNAWKEVEKYSPHRQPRGDREERFQHLAEPLHPHGRSGRIPADCGDCGGVGGVGSRSRRNEPKPARKYFKHLQCRTWIQQFSNRREIIQTTGLGLILIISLRSKEVRI